MPDIEQELRELAADVVVPEPPDVRAAVRARIGTPPPRRTLQPLRPLRPGWVAAVVAALLAALLIASPSARAAVADVFRFAGVDVQWGSNADDAPRVPESPLPGAESTDLTAAREQAAFEISVPTRLGDPDRVVVADHARVVSLLYHSPQGPIRLDEFDGRLEPIFAKTVQVTGVSASLTDGSAWWLPGPHTVRYVGRDGVVRDDTARLSASTLIWESGGVSYRLEANISMDEAIRVAESLEP
jgi:hypothetical protein